MPTLALSCLSLLFCVLHLAASQAMSAPPGKPPAHMEKYKAPDGSFALYKPPGWNVESRAVEHGKAVKVSDPKGESVVVLRTQKMRDPGAKATTIASRMLKDLRPTVPGLHIEWARSTRDRGRAVVEVRFAGARNVPMRGRYYFNTKYPDATVFGYEAPEREIERLRPTLLTVMTNFTILDPAGAAKDAGPPAPPRGISGIAMAERTAKDGSFSILVPKGWKMEGAKGQVLLAPPGDGIAGFINAPVGFWGPSQLPYFDASRVPGVIHSPYMRPVDALIVAMRATGSRNHRILERASDPARAREASVFLKRTMEVETATVSFDSKGGVRCQGRYDVSAAAPLPSGQWGINVSGIWAPQKEMEGYLPSLVKIVESYRINRQFADEYVRQGMEKVRKMAAETSAMMARNAREIRESSMAAYQERQRSQEYIDYKRTGYIRGEQEWVSEVEGGVIYKSDHWGLSREGEREIEGQAYNYYNFKGQNPRYNETMTPVDVSREVYEKVYPK
ncbi:MAG: hypothetical protein H6Q84_1388 [Deltaproteobacteria bacterium]|nr:hypothetical protein [Deltaproteobacteria bacterium]